MVGTLSHATGHRQNSALYGLSYASIGIENAKLKGLADFRIIQGFLAGYALADTTQELGQNYAGIASSAHNGAASGSGSYLAGLSIIAHSANFPSHGGHGMHHIGTCIAIRNRKNIQLIDGFIILLKAMISSQQHVLDLLTGYLLH